MWPSRRTSVALAITLTISGLLPVLFSGPPARAQTLDDRMSKAKPAKGEEVFARCGGCNTVEEGGRPKVGPNLWDVINRTVASEERFRYSETLQEFGGKWELERLDEYLSDPAGTVPGTRMNVPGVTDDTERADLIAYLNQNSANPLPIGLDTELEEAEAAAENDEPARQ
jgi:cytochrome c